MVARVIMSPRDIEVRLRQTGIEDLALELRLPCRRRLRHDKFVRNEFGPQSGPRSVGLHSWIPQPDPRQEHRRAPRFIHPNGGTAARPSDAEPTPLQLALVRCHRWLAMLESGVVKLLRELARREGVDTSYMSRLVNLTTLAPDIAAAILDETLPPEVTLFERAVDPPAVWQE